MLSLFHLTGTLTCAPGGCAACRRRKHKTYRWFIIALALCIMLLPPPPPNVRTGEQIQIISFPLTLANCAYLAIFLQNDQIQLENFPKTCSLVCHLELSRMIFFAGSFPRCLQLQPCSREQCLIKMDIWDSSSEGEQAKFQGLLKIILFKKQCTLRAFCSSFSSTPW